MSMPFDRSIPCLGSVPSLPETWRVVRLKWLARIFAGGTPSREEPAYWVEGTVPWLNSGAVQRGIITEPSEFITEDGLASSSARWIPSRSVVMALAGQGSTKGTAARLEIATTCNQSMAAIVPGPKLEYRYLHFWLTSSYSAIRRLGGGDLRDGLNLSHVGSIGCPVPPLTEQRAIADYLDGETARIDELIAKQQRLIELLRERRTSQIRELVCRGHVPSSLRDSSVDWIGRLPNHWDEVRLKWVVDSAMAGTWGAEPAGAADDILCVRVADFQRKTLSVGPASTLRSVPSGERRTRALRRGDLLLEKSGGTALNPVGFAAYWDYDVPAVCSNFIARLRLRPSHDSRYWLYALGAGYATRLTARSTKQTTGIQNLDTYSYFSETFPVPPLQEQRAIARELDSKTARIDALIAKAERFIELSKERRGALITAAVTGQIDVKAAA